jgi:hypothetical protein
LASLLGTGFSATDETNWGPAGGTLLRPRMLVAAAPTTRRQISAMIIIARVKPFSVSVDEPRSISRKLSDN